MTRPPLEDITLADALTRSLLRMKPLRKTETLPLRQSHGRILREDITAQIAVPPYDTAAVDGYAFHADDLRDGDTTLPVIGTSKPGHPYIGKIIRGVAWRVFTGAAMPKAKTDNGPDTVIMEEDCRTKENNSVTIQHGIKKGSNFRECGENVAIGTIALTIGARLGATEIGLAASLGHARLQVSKQLRVAILSTGDEITEPGNKTAHALHDSNRPMLAALLADDNMIPIDGGILRDDRAALTRAYRAALNNNADAIITTGGSSAGEEDHARPAILAAGGEVDFWRIAIKPGRPLALGRIGATPVFCLPGNPVASFVCYRMFVLPCLAAMQGAEMPPPLCLPVAAGFAHRAKSGRREYLRAKIGRGRNDRPAVFIHGRKGAGVLSSLTGADGLVEIPPDGDDNGGGITIGDMVNFIPFRERGL